jgi:hypothetical protein
MNKIFARLNGSYLIKTHIPFVLLTIVLGGAHTWAAVSRHSMNPDGISYLDIGDAYFRADWTLAINPVWPPLYAWLLGLVNFIVKPSMQWEFPTVQIVNFFIYLAALGSFLYLWKGLRSFLQPYNQNEWISFPEWLWWAIGYALFIWTSLSLIQIWAVTPDMLVAAILYLITGIIVRLRAASHGWQTYVLLGAILGLGYLAKTFMFSMAFVYLVLSLIITRVSVKAVLRTSLALGVFLLVSLPFVLTISQKVGRFTLGESGAITYLRYVGNIPFPHWQGDLQRGILPTHPSRLLLADPPVYEFGTPIGGTYPISIDPSYWYAGLEVPFSFGNQLARIVDGVIFYAELFLLRHGVFTACMIALLVIAIQQKAFSRSDVRNWALILPAAAGLGLYALVLVADRYVGAFILLFWGGILANIRMPNVQRNDSIIKTLSAIAVLGLLAVIALFNLEGINRLNPDRLAAAPAAAENPPPTWPGEVAIELQQLGIQPGDPVGVIGYAYDSFWARLARVKIVAEMLEADAEKFWVGDEALQADVVNAFARSGAKAVVAEYVPGYANLEGWHQVGISNYFIFTFIEP